MRHILFFGFGFSARHLAVRLDKGDWRITGTSRSAEGVDAIRAAGYDGMLFDALTHIPETVTHIVSSVPPNAAGDPVLQRFGGELAKRATAFSWVAYLSTTGVYGDHGGAWIDENTPLAPTTERGRRRLVAERAWLHLFTHAGLPVHLFRLAGIYGPGRNALASLANGTAKRVVKPGQVFSRIHVDDIAGILAASMARPNPGRVYNVADNEPCPPQDVVAYAAMLLDMVPPPEIDFEAAELTPMAQSFYAESKRVSNARVRQELGHDFIYPTYREGLQALLPGILKLINT